MRSAKNPSAPGVASRLGVGVLLVLTLTEFGCARMRAARRGEPPLELSDRLPPATSSALARNGNRGAVRPQIASRGGVRPMAPPQAYSVFRSTAPPPGALEPEVRLPAPPPVEVALQPPISTPAPAPAPTPAPAPIVASNPRSSPVPETPATSTPARSEPPARPDPNAEMTALVARARERLASLSTYQVQMDRQERVQSELQPAEEVVLSIRRQPRAVRLEWAEGAHKGREVLYVTGAHNGQMLVNMPGSLVPRVQMAPDSPLALSNSRHPITEAGFDPLLDTLNEALQLNQAGDPRAGSFRVEHKPVPEISNRACATITRVKPDGEVWAVSFDPATHLPLLVEAHDAQGQMLEHYHFHDLQVDLPDLAAAEAFDPDTRWGPPQGLLQRLARSRGAGAAESASPSR